MARASTSVYLRPGDRFGVREHPVDRYRTAPDVSVDLVDTEDGSAVWFLVEDPAALDGLISALTQARDWLAAEIAGQPALPAEPVGDTGLTLGPLPVGVA